MISDSDPVLRLGRHLADELDHSDVVGRWMAHHLSDLITRCESEANDEELVTTTREVVLKLWERKRGAHFRAEPFAYLRPVLEAIARLEPNPEPWAHYRPFTTDEPGVKELQAYPMLRAVCDIDREVGKLVRLGVAVAAREATSREEPWVIAGVQIADTEEDQAVRSLERLISLLTLQAGTDPRTSQERESPTQDGENHPEIQKPDDTQSSELDLVGRAESSDPDKALLTMLISAVENCKQSVEQMEKLSANLADGKKSSASDVTPRAGEVSRSSE
ncbi:hypothetical protein [Nocardiopsis sp. NRRL B-16309]|uniref:hypothetical protein n=1 Tax=Nocardiopsis sp. NRRL B-16309 TaxID=1519494 RepID=UPI000AA088CA|nr:hypothetical protein [Nocardiopsis sp. NRRL B-16309]